MRVGVIGAGAMGQNHIRAYSQMPGVELVGIADVDKARLEQLTKHYSIKGFQDYEGLLKEGLDAVSIVVPTTLHKKVALAAINAGTNLLVEKPIADSLDNARAILDASRKAGLVLMIGHIERFNPAVMKMKQIIDSGGLGDIVSISTRRVGPYNPRIRDVGVILDIGVHDIDVISYFYDDPVSEVYSIAGNVLHSFEDYATVLLNFSDNRAGMAEMNWLTPSKTRNFTVIGTEGVGYGDYMAQKVAIHDKEWVKEANVEKSEPLKNELINFIESCQGRAEPVTTGEDGLHALKVALAAIDSYKGGRAVKIL